MLAPSRGANFISILPRVPLTLYPGLLTFPLPGQSTIDFIKCNNEISNFPIFSWNEYIALPTESWNFKSQPNVWNSIQFFENHH